VKSARRWWWHESLANSIAVHACHAMAMQAADRCRCRCYSCTSVCRARRGEQTPRATSSAHACACATASWKEQERKEASVRRVRQPYRCALLLLCYGGTQWHGSRVMHVNWMGIGMAFHLCAAAAAKVCKLQETMRRDCRPSYRFTNYYYYYTSSSTHQKVRVVGCGAANGRRSILPGRGSAMVIFYLSITIHHCQYNAGAEYCWTRKANRIRARPRPRPRPAYCCSTSWFAYLGVETQPGPECRVLLLLTKSQCRTSGIKDIHTPASHVSHRSTHHQHNVGVKANTSRTLWGLRHTMDPAE
jgi:hypothetical protein